ncbi:MAG: STAS-like domain-containing protein [Duncaniella sp.]|nr:STAS-like domain-containing protein [Duncaniella sp.]
MNEIKIIDEVSLKQGVTPDEGMPIYNRIISWLDKGETVTLDFDQVELVTTAFLNVIIGKLYEKYTGEQLNNMLKFKNLTKSIAIRIKAVADTAKVYYKNQELFNKDVDSVLYGDN